EPAVAAAPVDAPRFGAAGGDVGARRRARPPEMADSRLRDEGERETARAHAVLPLRLLELEGEALVEPAGAIEHLAADGEDGARQVACQTAALPQPERLARAEREPRLVARRPATGGKLREIRQEARRPPGGKPHPSLHVPQRERSSRADRRIVDRFEKGPDGSRTEHDVRVAREDPERAG